MHYFVDVSIILSSSSLLPLFLSSSLLLPLHHMLHRQDSLHTSVLYRMRMNNQYQPPNLARRTSGWKWAVIRKQGDSVEECYVPQLVN